MRTDNDDTSVYNTRHVSLLLCPTLRRTSRGDGGGGGGVVLVVGVAVVVELRVRRTKRHRRTPRARRALSRVLSVYRRAV